MVYLRNSKLKAVEFGGLIVSETIREKSCGAVVVQLENDELRLLVRRKNQGVWSYPKGALKQNETEEQAAVNRIFEETGLKVSLIDDFKETIHYNPTPNVMKEVVYFIAKIEGGSLKESSEKDELQFVSLIDALALLNHESDATILKKVIHYIKVHSKEDADE